MDDLAFARRFGHPKGFLFWQAAVSADDGELEYSSILFWQAPTLACLRYAGGRNVRVVLNQVKRLVRPRTHRTLWPR